MRRFCRTFELKFDAVAFVWKHEDFSCMYVGTMRDRDLNCWKRFDVEYGL